MNFLREMHLRHERLKKFVHEGMRYPLPPAGQKLMGLVYFSIPVMAGYFIMNWTMERAQKSIGAQGEKLPPQPKTAGNTIVTESGEVQKVGAGGWGGGVRLMASDEETQKKNQEKIRKFLRRQQRLMKKEQQKESADESSSS